MNHHPVLNPKPASAVIDLEEESRYLLRTDAHCHIIPGVDDGSKSLEMSLNMARRAASFGCRTMVATPHGCHPALKCHLSPTDLRRRATDLNSALAEQNIPVTVLPGTEYLLNGQIPELYEDGQVITWADQNRYILIELGFHHVDPCMWDVLNYFVDNGVTPLLGHPERYTWLPEQPDTIRRLADLGCFFQINVMSINGLWGRMQQEMGFRLMRYAPRWIIATDSHSDADKFWGINDVRNATVAAGVWKADGSPRRTEISGRDEATLENLPTP